MVERERISALMDGELTDEEFAGRIQQLGSEEGAEDWRMYHLIGDALRGEMAVSDGFAEKVRAQIATEPTILAPGAAARKPARSFQHYALAAAASVVGLAVVGWFAVVNQPGAPEQVARQTSPERVVRPAEPARAAVAQLDPTVGEFLRAHQEESPTAVMHGVASYIRTVSTQDMPPEE
jgi:sigma-E factor negative regulatory protein RseA